MTWRITHYLAADGPSRHCPSTAGPSSAAASSSVQNSHRSGSLSRRRIAWRAVSFTRARLHMIAVPTSPATMPTPTPAAMPTPTAPSSCIALKRSTEPTSAAPTASAAASCPTRAPDDAGHRVERSREAAVARSQHGLRPEQRRGSPARASPSGPIPPRSRPGLRIGTVVEDTAAEAAEEGPSPLVR